MGSLRSGFGLFDRVGDDRYSDRPAPNINPVRIVLPVRGWADKMRLEIKYARRRFCCLEFYWLPAPISRRGLARVRLRRISNYGPACCRSERRLPHSMNPELRFMTSTIACWRSKTSGRQTVSTAEMSRKVNGRLIPSFLPSAPLVPEATHLGIGKPISTTGARTHSKRLTLSQVQSFPAILRSPPRIGSK